MQKLKYIKYEGDLKEQLDIFKDNIDKFYLFLDELFVDKENIEEVEAYQDKFSKQKYNISNLYEANEFLEDKLSDLDYELEGLSSENKDTTIILGYPNCLGGY